MVTEKRNPNASLKNMEKMHYLPMGQKQHLLSYLFIFAWNIIKSFCLFVKIRPDVVITTGTHTAVPMCFIAHFFKKKVIWIETFANSTTQTEAGKLVYPIADLFIVQWESMLELYPNAVMGGWIF
ncbi:MAG: PssD/Cps14F family polysaccharide biosynthesis glycosyltransferase [Holdemania massiliensis]